MARSKRKTSDKSDDENANHGKKRKMSGKDTSDILVDKSVFGKLVNNAGIVLKAKNKPNELTQDQAVFQRKLTLGLKRHANYPEVTDEFVEALVNHIEDAVRFRWSLMPSIVPLESEASSRGGTLDSMMRLLLGVDLLQTKIMEKLLEKLAELSGEEDAVFDDVEKVNIPKLIMNQFRWLDRIVDSKALVEKMFEILTVTSKSVQQEIITCIPEVIEDSQHGDVAKQLRDLLLESNELAVPVLDALSNMTLKPELIAEVRESVVGMLQSVSLEDMPVIVKFLLQTLTPADALDVVKELRAQLDLSSCVPARPRPGSKSRPPAPGRTPSQPEGVEALTVDGIRSAVRFQRFVAEAWVKAIDAVKSSADHKPLDLIVLLILHSNNHKKPIESLLRNKIRSGRFTEALLHDTFNTHNQVLREFFPSILSLSEVLLRSPEPTVTYFACAMYKQAFVVFDTYCQQEIVGNLVTHIGSGFDSEVDASLDILLELGQECLDKMVQFVIFVKVVLDYMDNLSVCQIRKQYALLSLLAFKNPREEGQIQDELHILIRKQLSHNDPKYQRMGVIGAIMVLQSMTGKPGPAGDSDDQGLSDDVYKQSLSLLTLVRTSCSRSSEASALFMDEMATIVQKGGLHTKVENWIAENFINDFQDEFVVDINPEKKESTNVLPWEQQFGLDDESEGSIAINVLPMVAKSYQSRAQLILKKAGPRTYPVVCLAPHFRLVQICEFRQHKGDLESIDALLGCPLYYPCAEVIDKFDSLSRKEKEVFCETVFFTINWFIENVNAFSSQEDAEMKGKVITRLQNITDLQKTLEMALSVTSDYIPPPANFDLDLIKPPKAAPEKKAKKPAGKGKKKSAKGSDDGDVSKDITMIDEMTQNDDKENTDTQHPSKDVTKSVVMIANYQNYFRELDLSVFTMLQVGLITKAALDTEMNTKDTTLLQIQPPQLEFLLKDLVRKTEHALVASASKRRTFLKTKSDKNAGFGHLDQLSPASVAKKLVSLLPSLCDHLEGTGAFFQALISSSDGVMDGPGFFTAEAQLMSSCIHLVLQVLLNVFTWNGFVMTQHRTLQKKALSVLAARHSSAANTSQLNLQDLLKASFQFVEQYCSCVPTLSAAVTMCKLLHTLATKSDTPQLEDKIGELSEQLLKREWYGPDGEKAKGAKHNEQLQALLKLYLDNSEDVLTCLENLSAVAVPELLDADRDGGSTTYPTLTRHSYPLYYRVMLSELVTVVKAFPPCKVTEPDQTKMEKLCRWNIAVRIFHILVNLCKQLDARSNLNAILKYGRQFMDIFLRQAMPMMDHMFRRHKDDVQSLLKNIQLSTRTLQHFCGHSKIVKDISLTNQVPLMKKVLEGFVYRVKAMLTVNKCIEAFWLGNLKNRDLHGEEIVSQSTLQESGGEESDGESVLPDDDDDESDVELDKESVAGKGEGSRNGSDDESYSETF